MSIYSRIDGGKFNTIGTRRNKPSLAYFNTITAAEQGPSSLTTVSPASPIKKRSPQFLKNNASYSSMSNKLFRRSLIGKQQQQLEQHQLHQQLDQSTDPPNNQSDPYNDDQSIPPPLPSAPAPFDNIPIDIPYTIHTPYNKKLLAKSSFNLCDDEKLTLSRLHCDNDNDNDGDVVGAISSERKPIAKKMHHELTAGSYCTLPRRPKSALCSFHTIVYEKGPGKKKLGFTVVGGTDTGAIGIFIKSILPTGQAGQDGRLKAGDEILAVNGQVCHDLSHEEAVKLFKSVKCGEIALQVCRRIKPAKLDA